MPAPAIAETREELRPFHRHSWTADRILIRTAIKQEIWKCLERGKALEVSFWSHAIFSFINQMICWERQAEFCGI